jgi:hypothetical protein
MRVQIVRFLDGAQPGIVACTFRDAQHEIHTIIDKLPVFTEARLWSDSKYPQPGLARCEVLERIVEGEGGSQVARITVARPDNLESVTGISEFLVLESEISDEGEW